MELAARNPELVARLVLIGPTLDREARNLGSTLPRFVMGGVHERTSMGLLLLKDYSRMGLRLLDELRAMFTNPIEASLPRVTAPVIFVRGEHDRIVPQRWMEELAALTPKSNVLVVPGAAHAAHYSHADALVRQIGPFLV
jgi:pimeloyl-ACP methyl ester carboxylesterase